MSLPAAFLPESANRPRSVQMCNNISSKIIQFGVRHIRWTSFPSDMRILFAELSQCPKKIGDFGCNVQRDILVYLLLLNYNFTLTLPFEFSYSILYCKKIPNTSSTPPITRSASPQTPSSPPPSHSQSLPPYAQPAHPKSSDPTSYHPFWYARV